ncbi:MAG TPA: glycosyltransferase family 4 protein, partial [Bacteroidales bacterium]|nr:glycosyltransferase family 4 protein [Bacteroidales bacterium]
MRIAVLGTRGFPDIQGGVEQHCEKLYPFLAKGDCFITVYRRKPYISNHDKSFENIKFIDLPSTRIPGFEAFYHSFLGSVSCIFKRPDIVHIHNIGPGFFTPLLKMAGLKVILTYHSPNYEHAKWSSAARAFLKFAESLSTKFSDKVIFVSKYQKSKFSGNSKLIHINNGVVFNAPSKEDDYLKKLGLEKERYVLAVGRLVKEKG